MVQVSSDFIVSTEHECLTVDAGDPSATVQATSRFMSKLSKLAPSLPGPSGLFNAYGRVYSDLAHAEFASIEAHDPYFLTVVIEQQFILAARAVEQLAREGHRLILANNNHSGLLESGCAVWGAHENYMTEQHPSTLTNLILPFMCTRIYQGAGGIESPYGNFLAAVRPICMQLATGGDTTSHRAIHSTAREEHHMGHQPKRFRYHQILGDGHRISYNQALQFGCSALALKGVIFDKQLSGELAKLPEFPPAHGNWVALLREINVLARPGQPLQVHPLVVKTQKVYLESARRYVDMLQDVPQWIPRMLQDWQETLTALEHLDRAWLAPRLDAFAKYEFYSAVLREAGHTWSDLPGHPHLFQELALLDHSYHEFCNPNSVFRRLEHAGLIAPRVADVPPPGEEPEPFVPAVQSRALARARFIRDHGNGGPSNLIVDWSYIRNTKTGTIIDLTDPFAQECGEWHKRAPAAAAVRGTGQPDTAGLITEVQEAYYRGDYGAAAGYIRQAERAPGGLGRTLQRYRAWVQSRQGQNDTFRILDQYYGGRPLGIPEINDYCCAFRFGRFIPDPRIEQYLAQGHELLRETDLRDSSIATFREHAGFTLLRNERAEQAIEILCAPHGRSPLRAVENRIHARSLATQGDAYRMVHDRRRARRLLLAAEQIQTQHSFLGDQSDFTFASLAKLERSRRRALEWLTRARRIQIASQNHPGMAQTLVLEARITSDKQLQARNRETLVHLQQGIPTLREDPLLAQILNNWTSWVGNEPAEGHSDEFWGV